MVGRDTLVLDNSNGHPLVLFGEKMYGLGLDYSQFYSPMRQMESSTHARDFHSLF
jgi:hypothetical protein